MNNTIVCLAALSLISLGTGCKKYLDYEPKGTLTAAQLQTPQEVDKLVTAAYASLGNDYNDAPLASMWVWGSMRSDDAYKGGGGVANRTEYNQLEQYNLVTVTNTSSNLVWTTLYAGIARTNAALKGIKALSDADYPNKKQRQAEMRFLRGHYHFLARQLFKNIPYADDNTSSDSLKFISNRQFTNDQLWNKIAEDFQYGVDNLPAAQTEIGRVNKYAASAYLAKLRLYQAYEQDDNHQVARINQQRLGEAVTLLDNVISSGKYGLFDDFAKNFLVENENGMESIFAIQFSINDGTSVGRLNMGTNLNYNMATEYGCCWFHVPTQNLVNSFKTDAAGLPMFTGFNASEMKEPADFLANGVDPRLDHTVGIIGHPFKYKSDFVYKPTWARVPEVYGYYSTMKEIAPPDCSCLQKVGAYFGSSKNADVIRYDDVLLMKAEALIEMGRHPEALPLINQIRTRARNSTGRLKLANGTYASNYRIDNYVNGVNCNWTQDFARTALRWERRLEFAMESPRFFDLVRWGIAAETLNAYLGVEKLRHSFLQSANFTKGRDEFLPVPQPQIDLVEGLYKQNPGY
ncbi:MAG: RagB/SusD family nutrient uptake outer membrane protein [Williamsia sp.]|nr:RagB/SusD family nutrient uptake outer membrane protein [Williamsia sp.]